MQALPHHYQVSASGRADGNLELTSDGLPSLTGAPPAEFDGPGNEWSPETLLMASVSSCFILSFRAVAAASRFDWTRIECQANGTLDRVERTNRFTTITNRVTLVVPAGTDTEKAEKLLHKAESVCLISNSLDAEVSLDITIQSGE